MPQISKSIVLNYINAELDRWKCGIDRVEYDDATGKTVVVSLNPTLALLFTRELANFLGFKTEAVIKDMEFQNWEQSEWEHYYKTLVKPQPIFGGPKNDFHPEMRYLFSERKRNIGPKLIFVNADCVNHHLVGNTWSQILVILPNKDTSRFRFKRPCFFPLYCNRFDKITIKLTDEHGEILNSSQRVILVLEIQRFRG